MNTQMLEQALRCQALGFSVFPVGRNKIPLISWKQYQNERATPEQIKAWFTQFPDMNIGCATGAISGIIVVDVEKGGPVETFPKTATVRTGGLGWHLYYKYPNQTIKNSARKLAELTDVRGDGGYVVLPPSIHASGNAYEWLTPPEDGFTDIPVDLLQRMTESNPNKLDSVKIVEGMRNETATKYIGRVLHHLPLDLFESAGWAALKDWNATIAHPPLNEGELGLIFASISQREQKNRGDKDSSAKPVNFTPFTLTDLYKEEFPPGRWVIQDLIPLGTITALTGDSNTYKTFLTQSMAASIASGIPFLGHFPTTPGKVLIVDEENHRRQVQERFKDLGINATLDIIFLSLEGVKVDNEEHIEKLKEIIEKEKPVLVIFDSLVRLHGGEENSATEMSATFSGMKKLICDDLAILFIHHHRKPQGFAKKSSSQSIRGSSDILAAVDAHLAVDRKDTDFTISQTKMRLQPEIKPFKASLVPTEKGTWEFVYKGVDTSEDDRIQESYDAVKGALAEASEPLTIDMLADETQLPLARLRQTVRDLLKSKEVVVAKVGAHGVHYYELALEEPVSMPI
ncbi:MAG: hypothetical protein A3C50_01255 [Candidatus Staskawiczbacteria bacterium RIFCSPHIGHO2_02_FULL_43_16]|uniref:DNA primase/polymerase bifunctional N-terminal domain-containing protein n=1 Tax=Candidatus Staskawiczbacteria bacterium RIFCSPHIGHO2_01_FULL_41_41 TaxID=1802203 RepID=A0A1G2HV43_9BACT|nr:MAG: hypothetical protein A2822_04660 [Candidatus Staskawiczbacteria bacterium RIFCSPHIGHO2_01_FULL_41_41]OGZ68836.1 MAG: hypothetical protein A3C50_01255 [Candidatus Staskawiczbacteria bacterium RIFCSPHIGHO2_02_FULL_43_16]OGZ74209.1 MAG: hypothetical protein A3A12_00245 [Candidatus Staskawiczbacteria bacterium RIFCSPLOWO2_01_FULL_43_17b]